MFEVGKTESRSKIKIDPNKIQRHTTEFPSLVEIVLDLFGTHIDITLITTDARNSTIRSYKPTISPYEIKENPEDEKRHRKRYQRQFAELKETAIKEYEKILRKVKEGRYILHLYDDGRVDLKLT